MPKYLIYRDCNDAKEELWKKQLIRGIGDFKQLTTYTVVIMYLICHCVQNFASKVFVLRIEGSF